MGKLIQFDEFKKRRAKQEIINNDAFLVTPTKFIDELISNLDRFVWMLEKDKD